MSILTPLEYFTPNQQVEIRGELYTFIPGNREGKLFAIRDGGQSDIVKIQGADGKFFALKMFKKHFRDSSILQRCHLVRELRSIHGMQAADLFVINPDDTVYQKLLKKYPLLEYSVIMPWINHPTWQRERCDKIHTNYVNCRQRALNFANLVNNLCIAQYAHCDICPANIHTADNDDIFLIDFENIYHPTLAAPPWGLPSGQQGYRHPNIEKRQDKQWNKYGDRFGSALLIAEFLVWHYSGIREASLGETFFSQEEINRRSPEKYHMLELALKALSQSCADLFTIVWNSNDLEDCPSIDDWMQCIRDLPATLGDVASSLQIEPLVRREHVPHSRALPRVEPPNRYPAQTAVSSSPTNTLPPGQMGAKATSSHSVSRTPVQHSRVQAGHRVDRVPARQSFPVVERPIGQVTHQPPQPQPAQTYLPSNPSPIPPAPSMPSSQTKSSSSGAGCFFAVLVLLLLLGFVCATTSKVNSITLSSTSDWYNTDHNVEADSWVCIFASGEWSLDQYTQKKVGPNGYSDEDDSQLISTIGTDCKRYKEVPYGSLIANIGDWLFFIGDTRCFQAPEEGTLYLSINDAPQCQGDNEGELSITIFTTSLLK